MKKTLLHLLLIFVIFSCSSRKNKKIDLDGIKDRIKEQGTFVTQNALKFFEGIPSDSLYRIILKRYDPSGYPIEFLLNSNIEYEVFPLPFFTFSKEKLSQNSFILLPDNAFLTGFLLFDNQPLAEFFLDQDEEEGVFKQDYIQNVRKELWQHYQDLIDKKYPVFMGNIKIQDSQTDGTMFLPYVFYIDHEDKVLALNLLKNDTLTLNEVLQKIP